MSYKSEEQMIEKKRRTRSDLFTLESHFKRGRKSMAGGFSLCSVRLN